MKLADHEYDLEVVALMQDLSESFSASSSGKKDLRRPIHFPPAGTYLLNGIRYHSRPEAACGFLIEKYIPAFSLEFGKTFQVPIGVGSGGDLQTVDFRFGDLFIEYHPPRVHGHREKRKGRAQREPRELQRLRGVLRRRGLSREMKDRTYARIRAYLTRRYFEKRMNVLSESPVVGDFSLVVLGSPEELYRHLLVPHAERRLPKLRTFTEEFTALLKKVVDLREG
ncbi:hypothetical protein MRY87_02960 [bacterium]|nr:hypothetical protein [bacterium]